MKKVDVIKGDLGPKQRPHDSGSAGGPRDAGAPRHPPSEPELEAAESEMPVWAVSSFELEQGVDVTELGDTVPGALLDLDQKNDPKESGK